MIMRIAPNVLFLLGALLTQAVQATSSVVDARQSYLKLDIPTWRQGDPFTFTNTDTGEITIWGYQWFLDSQTERYELSGRFRIIDGQAESDGSIPFNWADIALFTNAPSQAQFSLPGFLAYNSMSGQISKQVLSCPWLEGITSACLIFSLPDYSTVSGSRSSNSLTLDGIQQTGVSFAYAAEFSLDRPLDPEVTNPSVRYHLVATAVPEPSLALTMLAGLVMIYAARRRSVFR